MLTDSNPSRLDPVRLFVRYLPRWSEKRLGQNSRTRPLAQNAANDCKFPVFFTGCQDEWAKIIRIVAQSFCLGPCKIRVFLPHGQREKRVWAKTPRLVAKTHAFRRKSLFRKQLLRSHEDCSGRVHLHRNLGDSLIPASGAA